MEICSNLFTMAHCFVNESSESESCYNVSSDSEDEIEEEVEHLEMTDEIKCMFETVYKYYVKELKIQCDLRDFYENRVDLVDGKMHEVLVNIEMIVSKLHRFYEICKHVKIYNSVPEAQHALEVDVKNLSMGKNLAITSEELNEAIHINQYCFLHVKCLCSCKNSLLL